MPESKNIMTIAKNVKQCQKKNFHHSSETNQFRGADDRYEIFKVAQPRLILRATRPNDARMLVALVIGRLLNSSDLKWLLV